MTMKRTIILLFAAFSLLFFSFDAQSQELAKFPQDPKISTGVLPDGISYYIVSNSTMKGMADFALVQKVGTSDEDSLSAGKVLSIARSSIASVPKFGSRAPETFLVSYGMSSRKGMLVDVRDDATIYRFEKMPLAYGNSAVDSTLLMIFDIIEGTSFQNDDFFRKHYPTSSYAIIVSGDVNKDAVLSKMKMLSLMVPERKSDIARREYRWIPSDNASCTVKRDTTKGYSKVSVSYSSPRTPDKYMNTVLPAVNGRLGDILGTVLKKRLYEEFRQRDIPVSKVDYRYQKSSERSGDERYELSVYTAPDCVEQVVGVIGNVCSQVDRYGIGPGEYAGAKDEYLVDVYDEAKRPRLSNRKILDKCISSFLYGSDLSVPMDRFNFFMSAKMPDSTQTRFFNRFASELLDSTKNLSINCMTPYEGVSGERLVSVFESAWKNRTLSGNMHLYPAKCSDDMSSNVENVKLKVSSERKEPVSGGLLWTFSNGMKVVYKRLPTDGIFYYTMLLKEGYSAMPDIRRGEGAFLSSILETFDIAGLESDDFHYMMNEAGVTMSSSVTASGIKLYGKVPRPGLPVMMRSLKAVANDRTVNMDKYNYMRKCMEVSLAVRKGSVSDRMAAIDSLMCPSYIYSQEMSIENMSDDLPYRAEKFFESRFSQMNDGVLVIVGDMEETAMKKFLLKELGAFRTRPVSLYNPRPSYQPISGWSTYIKEGESQSVDVVMSTQMTFTVENYMAARVAALAISDAVAKALCGTATYFRVSYNAIVYPQERFNIAVSVYEADPSGSPSGARVINSLESLYIVRNAVYRLSKSSGEIKDLDVYKSMLKNEISSRQNDPQHIMDMVSMRFSAGKDLNTKYEEKINSVTGRQVLDIISSLDEGSKIEYVITKR